MQLSIIKMLLKWRNVYFQGMDLCLTSGGTCAHILLILKSDVALVTYTNCCLSVSLLTILKRLKVNSEKTLSEGIVCGADMFADGISWSQENLINITPDHLIWYPVSIV